MDSLEDFEKSLAAEKARREESERGHEERRHRKHRHRHDDDRSEREDRHRHRDRERDRDRDRGGNRERDSHRHSRHHHDQDDDYDEGHRHKRSRQSHDDDDERRHRHQHRHHDHNDSHREKRRSDPSEVKGEHVSKSADDKSPDSESIDQSKAPVRDAWMTTPSAFEVEHINRLGKNKPRSPTPEPPKRVIHKRELNSSHLEGLNSGASPSASDRPAERTVDYTFGDVGSAWRMTKLKAVYTTAEETGKSVEEIAVQRFGGLEFFDDAREEMEEMERRRIYKDDYETRDKPTGELYRERMKSHRRDRSPSAESSSLREEGSGEIGSNQKTQPVSVPSADPTALNRLRAHMMKAKLRRAPNAAQLEEEYNRAAAAAANATSSGVTAPEAVVLGVMESRQLAGTRGEVKAVDTKRGRERGLVEENNDMSIDDMLREERRTKGQAGGEGMRLAERIAKDAKFDDDLEYMDENAEKLAKRVHKSDINLKNVAVNEFQRLNRILETCPLCHKEDQGLPPLAPIVSLATRVFLTLPTEPEISSGGAMIVPTAHRRNLLECDDDEWEEMRNFMKSLTRMYHDRGQEVLFYENAAAPQRHLHAAMMAVPIPYDQGAMAPAFFKEAFLSSDEEWSQHRKVIDTAAKAVKDGMGRMAFRRSIAKEAPYFHVWFTLDGGLAHVVENADKWPKGDLFAREVIGGIVDAEPHVIKKQGRWSKSDSRVDGFKRGWRKFDWTRVLMDG